FVFGSSLGGHALYQNLDTDLFELHDGNLPPFLRGLGDRRTLELQPGRTYLLASDGLWHLQRPQAFVQRWPQWLGGTDRPLTDQLEALCEALVRQVRSESGNRGDNSTAIALRLRS
ncbi:MAG: hypothetical protein R3202_13645, partial [Candidatus Competibacterales bacterium]|nr:hypothetical protein [Candidatus Competibacterales bacterium]